MKALLVLVFGIFNGLCNYAIGGGDTCLEPERARNLLTKFHLVRQESKQSSSPIQLSPICHSESLEHRILLALAFVEDLKESAEPELSRLPFAPEVIKMSFYTYLTSRPKTFVLAMNSDLNCSASGTMGYADQRNSTIHICERASKATILNLAEVLIHESRHLEGNGFDHVECTRGIFKSKVQFSCDSTLQMKGAYAYSFDFYRRVARSQNINSAIRLESKQLAILNLLNHFREIPSGISEGFFLQETNGQINFFNGRALIPFAKRSPNDLMILRLGTPTFYNAINGRIESVFAADVATETLGNYALEFRNSMSPEKRKSLVDIYYYQNPLDLSGYSCELFKTYIRCDNILSGTSPSAVAQLPQISPTGFIQLGSEIAVSDSDGKLYFLPNNLDVLRKTPFKNFKVLQGPDYIRPGCFFNSKYWSIDLNGELVKSTSPLSPTSAVTELKSHQFKKIIGPAYFSKDFEML